MKRLYIILIIAALFIVVLPLNVAADAPNVTFISNSSQYYSEIVNTGVLVTKPDDPTLQGYDFGGWFTESSTFSDSDKWDFDNNHMPDGALTLYAKWTAITYKVSYDSNGGDSGTSMDDSLFTYDVSSALKTNIYTKANYTFSGWALTSGGSVTFANGAGVSNLTITDNDTVKLYAVWVLNSHTVTFAPNNGGSSSAETVSCGDHITKPTTDPEKTGYILGGWYNGDKEWKFDTDTMPDNDITLTSMWIPITYTVKYNASGGIGMMVDSSLNYGISAPLRQNTFTRAGYAFSGWASQAGGDVVYTDGQSVTNLEDTQDTTVNLYAVWVAYTPSVQGKITSSVDNGTFTQYLPLPSAGTSWSFDRPQGIATDIYGNVYVADTYDSVIQKLNSNGEIIAKWGTLGGGEGELDYVSGIAINSEGNVYVTNSTEGYTVGKDGTFVDCKVEVFDSNGKYLKEWGSYGDGDGQFERPEGIAIDSDDNVYVADYMTCRVEKFDKDGNFSKEWGGNGSADGQFGGCIGIAVDNSGYVYVADMGNRRIEKFDNEGNFISKWKISGMNGDAEEIAVDNHGYLYVAVADEGAGCTIQKFTSGGVFLKKWAKIGKPRMDEVYGIAADTFGNIYIGESLSVMKLSNTGSLLARWGSIGTNNGAFNQLCDIAFDSQNNLYVLDRNNYRVQKFDSKGNFIRRWSIKRPEDLRGDFPKMLAIDNEDNVYVTNSCNQRFDVYNTDGKFLKSRWLEGNDRWYVEGTGHIDFDSEGNIFIANYVTKELQVYSQDLKFIKSFTAHDESGQVTPAYSNFCIGPHGLLYLFNDNKVIVNDINGNYVKGFKLFNDDELHFIYGCYCDNDGNVYLTDIENNTIREYDPSGDQIGQWGKRGTGDNQFSCPIAVKVDKAGNVFVADEGNSRVMMKPVNSSEVPSVDYMSLSTSPNLGYTPGGSNSMSMDIGVTTKSEATLSAYVFNTKGKWVAQVSATADKSGEYKFDWDGKATAGNTATITAGKLVPSSSSGTSYKIRAYVQNGTGSSWSTIQTIKFYSSSKVKWIGISNSKIASGQKASFTFQVAHFSNVQVQILDSLGRIAAIYDEGAVFPNRNVTVTWDGLATEGNGMSLSSGTAVPSGKYTIKIIAGSTKYSAKNKITVF